MGVSREAVEGSDAATQRFRIVRSSDTHLAQVFVFQQREPLPGITGLSTLSSVVDVFPAPESSRPLPADTIVPFHRVTDAQARLQLLCPPLKRQEEDTPSLAMVPVEEPDSQDGKERRYKLVSLRRLIENLPIDEEDLPSDRFFEEVARPVEIVGDEELAIKYPAIEDRVVAYGVFRYIVDRRIRNNKPVPHLPEEIVDDPDIWKRSTLTPQALRVLYFIGYGLTNSEISQHVSISDHTFRDHSTQILDKLDEPTRLGAVASGIETGYLEQPLLRNGYHHESYYLLTPKKQSVARFICENPHDPTVIESAANAIFVQKKTAKNHETAILQKLGLRSILDIFLFESGRKNWIRTEREKPLTPEERDLLALLGSGYSGAAIEGVSSDRAKLIKRKLFDRFEVINSAQLLKKAIEAGAVVPDAQELGSSFNLSNIRKILPAELSLLREITELPYEDFEHKLLAQAVGLTKPVFDAQIESLLQTLGVRNFEQAMLFFALTQVPELSERVVHDKWKPSEGDMQLLVSLAQGLSYREIAKRFGVTERRVKEDGLAIFTQLEVSNREQAVAAAIELGLLDVQILSTDDDLERFRGLGFRRKQVVMAYGNRELLRSQKAIAESLGIELNTLQIYLGEIYKIFGVSTPGQLSIIAKDAERAGIPIDASPSPATILPFELTISSHQRETICLIREGKSNSEISVIRGITVKTVINTITDLKRKFGLEQEPRMKSRYQLVSAALEHGLID